MRDVVVIGGGLSGLAACYALEKQQIRYTLIEVKRRVGGSIVSCMDKGFVTDASAFAIKNFDDPSLLVEFDLNEQIFTLGEAGFGFCGGTESLTDALWTRLGGGRLLRMAVSSIGHMNGRFALCLENGLMLDAGAVIVAAPARYAARMLYNLMPAAAARLQEYQYDRIYRVSLGYHKRDLPRTRPRSFGVIYPFVFSTDAPGRVPSDDHQLLQVGARSNADLDAYRLVRQVIRHYGWGEKPLIERVDYWEEADPLSCYDDDHRARMAAIRDDLPAGISLIGSDYCLDAPQQRGVARLEERLRQGKDAAQLAMDHLRTVKRR